MRTIGLIADIPKETDLFKFPDSTIINETEVAEGTPVVREIYGDILTNLYKLLRVTGITANGFEDNELNDYQIVEALRKLPNVLNDSEQVLNLSGTQFILNLNLGLLPDKYFVFARASENYDEGETYTLIGNSGPEEYQFTAVNGFSSGDELLIILDQSTVRAYNLSSPNVAPTVPAVFTPFGTPVAFNSSNKVWYESQGVLFSDVPESYDLQAAIRLLESDGLLQVYEMLVIGNFVLCLVYDPTANTYALYKFSISNLSAPSLLTMSGGSFPIGADNRPNIYTDGDTLYITNATGNTANNYEIDKYDFDLSTGTVTKTGSISIADVFAKTTNAVVKAGSIYTFVSGELRKYSLSTGVESLITTVPGNLGVLFGLNGEVYYSNDEVARKWTLS